MNILSISDTHNFHRELHPLLFEGVDMVIHAGDFSNHKIPSMNVSESEDFLEWYDSLHVKYKVLICGNHDTSIEAKLVNPRDYKNITYLEHESVNIEGINIFGSPYTKEFNNWAFNVRPDRLNLYWEQIPESTDILVVHGPPKGILDLSYSPSNVLERCGDKALYRHIQRVLPKQVIFGHIHNNADCYNSGFFKDSSNNVMYRNVTCVTDRKFDLGLTSKGQKFIYE
jgi:Icc-related predicted phosphoesterase